jgi:hypothetical protein
MTIKVDTTTGTRILVSYNPFSVIGVTREEYAKEYSCYKILGHFTHCASIEEAEKLYPEYFV